MSSYVVYADEAWTHDPSLRFWRFYAGAMVLAEDRKRIEDALNALKVRLGLEAEIKWTKVRPFNWERIAIVMDCFFDFVEMGQIRLRYMWIDQLFHSPADLTEHHEEYGYYILYYFFLIFGFGLPWHEDADSVQVELFLDRLPDQPAKRKSFQEFLMNCHTAARFKDKSRFRIATVGDVNSEQHILLQCADIIAGAVGFRLNQKHKAKQKNGRRSEGTKIKEQLYNRVRDRLGAIDMGERGGKSFAVGVNTGRASDFGNLWRNKFRQWNFRRKGAFNSAWAKRKTK